MNRYWIYIVYLYSILLLSCSTNHTNDEVKYGQQLYVQVPSEKSNLKFFNAIRETEKFNYFFYPDIYSGGGVAIGDINNDGLPDLFFSGIMVNNALYLNLGGMKFKDITEQAGVGGTNKWTKGVTMADVNNDGWLDLYVSVSGPFPNKKNLLYLNNRDNTFKEMAQKFGIADDGYSVQSAFFDYDRDGDLDLFIASNPPALFQSRNSFYEKKMKNPDPFETDRLYRNEGNNKFRDVTREAGLLNYGLTLGLSIADFNNDGWFDIYLSNDFNSADYLFINNGDGSFSNEIEKYMMHTSQFGMGSDAADINNDGLIDLLQLDMAYKTNQKSKTNMHSMDSKQFYDMVQRGLHYQYMRNSLQLNTGLQSFSDIAELAGVANTDWSWGSLLMDMNNDGLKDIFITNGMRRDVNNSDFISYVKQLEASNKLEVSKSFELLEKIPSNPVENYVYINNGNLTFDHSENNYGLNFKGFSHGSAYADLDLDGDLDVVVNNLDEVSQIFENISNVGEGSAFIRFKMKGPGENIFGIGTTMTIYYNGKAQYQELIATRGYLSAVEPIIHFGVGNTSVIDSAIVNWPDGGHQLFYDLPVNQLMDITWDKKNFSESFNKELKYSFFESDELSLTPSYIHRENNYNDFAREVLLPHKMSEFGPALAVSDVNRDGLEDFFVGGAMGFQGMLYLQESNGTFIASQVEFWNEDKKYEDVSALFFDANNDGFADLYVVSGGNEKPIGDPVYQDRIYLNNGHGIFKKASKALPEFHISGSRVICSDFDRDGDLDLFVGGRQTPGKYPTPPNSYLLSNVSDGQTISFKNITAEAAPMLMELGMVTDATWADYNGDGWIDLIIVGEWMPITLLENKQGIFIDVSRKFNLDKQVGMWSSITSADIDNDGDLDFVAGNLGLNYKYKASVKEPFQIYSGDFDDNGNLDIVLAYYNNNELFPLRGKEYSSQQIPEIDSKFSNYIDFANANLIDVYGEEKLATSLHYEAVTFASTLFVNHGGQSITTNVLSNYAQISSVNAIVIDDFNGDNNPDLLLAGNMFDPEVDTPRNDSSYGLLMLGNGKGDFQPLMPHESGLHIRGEVREVAKIKMFDGKYGLLISRNKDQLALIININNN